MKVAPRILPAERYAYVLIMLLLIGIRLFHLDGPIDDPHSWRQCDTAQYVLDFYESGIDLFHPGVCWMGGHKTLILEFPLPEALVAVGYHLLGPDHAVARVIFLLIFLASAFYLYRIAAYLYHERIAWLSGAVYLSLPLGIFYSRAIHVDFSALLCGLAAVDAFLRGLGEDRPRLILLSIVWATCGFLIKAPYLFYFALPVGWWIWQQRKMHQALKYAPLLLVPIAAFVGWRLHTQSVNAAAPDWFFIPGYLKMAGAGMSDWYFGTWEQRQDLYIWKVLFRERLWVEVLAKVGLAFVLLGFCWPRTSEGRSTHFARLWLIVVLLYMALFFNLNYFHNYYQIPFLPIVALLMAIGIAVLAERLPGTPKLTAGLAILLLTVMGIWNVRTAETHPHYYHLDQPLIEAGQLLQTATEKEELLLLSRSLTDPRNPLLLYRARRKGWSVHIDRITPEVIRELQRAGASRAGFLTKALTDSTVKAYLEPFPVDTFGPVSDGRHIFLYDLRGGQSAK